MSIEEINQQVEKIIGNYSGGFEPTCDDDVDDAKQAEAFIRTALRIAILEAQCKSNQKHSSKRSSKVKKISKRLRSQRSR